MKIITRFFVIFISAFIFSCAEETDIFEEKFQKNTNVETGLILDYINQEFVVLNQPSSCFEFKYPITLSTNTNNVIYIENEKGLKKLTISFNSKFYVTGIKLPVTINAKEVESTAVFKNQMDQCEIATFKKVVDQNIEQCFSFEYPLLLLGADGQIETTESLEQYQQFLQNQGGDYELLIQYPITIVSNTGKIKLNTNFDLYQVINSCNTNCNNYTISATLQDLQNSNSTFEIKAETPNEIESIQWFLDDKLVETETSIKFNNKFKEIKNYRVCAKVKFANCLATSEICKIITITDEQISICNKIQVELQETQTQGVYDFFTIAGEFGDAFGNSEFEWRINDEIQSDFQSASFNFKFKEVGQYEICATLIDGNCPDKPKACVVLNLNSDQIFK